MRRRFPVLLPALLLLLLPAALAGCRLPGGAQPAPPAEAGPDLTAISPALLTRDQVRDGLARLMNAPGPEPAARLDALLDRHGLRPPQEDAVPWLAADLDGDGSEEFVLALPVTDPGAPDHRRGQGAALFVIHRRDGRYAVDRTDPMAEGAEPDLMQPVLHAAADLAGTGRPQIVWSRPHRIASGPRPVSVFVTAWQPGAFTRLPGEMVISATVRGPARVRAEGQDLVLTGGSREQMFLRARADRYRFVDGAFRLVDRRFTEPAESAYDRFWDGLVAEAVGRTAAAGQDYRAAMDPERLPHPGTVPRYNAPPVELTPAELAAFGDALRAFARFRLGGLLMAAGQREEARAVLAAGGGAFRGLTEAMGRADSREAGCRAAAAWAAAHPDFLTALNRGVADTPWTPDLLCTHPPLADPPAGSPP